MNQPPNLTAEQRATVLGDPNKASSFKSQVSSDPADELVKLRARKAQLEEVIFLQEEVAVMETRLLLGSHPVAVIGRTVANVVCEHYKLALVLLTGRCREEHIVWPRQVTSHLIRTLSGAPYQLIGEIMLRHHGAILHGCARVKDRMETEPATRAEVEALEAECLRRLRTLKLESSLLKPSATENLKLKT